MMGGERPSHSAGPVVDSDPSRCPGAGFPVNLEANMIYCKSIVVALIAAAALAAEAGAE